MATGGGIILLSVLSLSDPLGAIAGIGLIILGLVSGVYIEEWVVEIAQN